MQSVTVCRFCGRTIDQSYIFCPWCGISRVNGESLVSISNQVFTQLEEIQAQTQTDRIGRLERSLNQLEQELARFMESVEKT